MTRTSKCIVHGSVLSIVLLAACNEPLPEQLDVVGSELVHASVTSGDPAVGIVGACTGTLIGRRTVLTAAHCGSHLGSARFDAYPCGNAAGCIAQSASGRFVVHPEFNGGFDHDVAVVLLDRDFTSQTGIVPRRIGAVPVVGGVFRLVGYGEAEGGAPFGQKRTGTNTIDECHSQTLDFEDTSRALGEDGDSGGPAFAPTHTDCEMGMFVGVTSTCFLGFCDHEWKLARLDTKLAWIKQASADSSVHACNETACGDGLCQGLEGCSSCPGDCGACPPPPPNVCGDGNCTGGESCSTCGTDCGRCCPANTSDCCGDGVCRSLGVCNRIGC
jgi:Trypsin